MVVQTPARPGRTARCPRIPRPLPPLPCRRCRVAAAHCCSLLLTALWRLRDAHRPAVQHRRGVDRLRALVVGRVLTVTRPTITGVLEALELTAAAWSACDRLFSARRLAYDMEFSFWLLHLAGHVGQIIEGANGDLHIDTGTLHHGIQPVLFVKCCHSSRAIIVCAPLVLTYTGQASREHNGTV